MLNFIKNFILKLLGRNKDQESEETQKPELPVNQWQFSECALRRTFLTGESP